MKKYYSMWLLMILCALIAGISGYEMATRNSSHMGKLGVGDKLPEVGKRCVDNPGLCKLGTLNKSTVGELNKEVEAHGLKDLAAVLVIDTDGNTVFLHSEDDVQLRRDIPKDPTVRGESEKFELIPYTGSTCFRWISITNGGSRLSDYCVKWIP